MKDEKIVVNRYDNRPATNCIFQDAARDLEDFSDSLMESDFMEQDLSPEELRAKRRLVELCKNIADEFGRNK